MKLKSHLAASAAAGILAMALGAGAMPAAQASGKTYTQEVASAGTCTKMETATIHAFRASGYEVSGHACLKSAGGYTLMIDYSK
ncbi:hypothetical protein [Glutamicibacter sp. TV12E]|uniref:hypothetical protein n=1 Tax=Glutamicibacter sp. TV12E TaxID=3446362 RepID=UPI004033DCFB